MSCVWPKFECVKKAFSAYVNMASVCVYGQSVWPGHWAGSAVGFDLDFAFIQRITVSNISVLSVCLSGYECWAVSGTVGRSAGVSTLLAFSCSAIFVSVLTIHRSSVLKGQFTQNNHSKPVWLSFFYKTHFLTFFLRTSSMSASQRFLIRSTGSRWRRASTSP